MNFEKLISLAQEKGMEDVEVYRVTVSGFECDTFDGEIDNYTVKESDACAIRGIYNGHLGQIKLENLERTDLENIVDQLIENAKAVETPDEVEIFAGSKEYPKDEYQYVNLDSISTEEKIQYLMDTTSYMKELDSRVQNIEIGYSESKYSVEIFNSKGLKLSKNSAMFYFFVEAVCSDGNETKTGLTLYRDNHYSLEDLKSKAKEAVKEATDKFSAKPVDSGKYSVIFKNTCFASILGAFSSMFSAEAAKQNISLLKDKVGTKIGNDLITLIDDPLSPYYPSHSTFDDEGVACRKKVLVENGMLHTLLHNIKTAKFFHTESTGNGFKPNLSSPIGVEPSILYLEKGEVDFEDLCKECKNGLLITEVQGLHAGLNPISGDFSLQSTGFKIEDGKITEPVNLIVVAGNILDVFKTMKNKANDLSFFMSPIGSPSILVENLTVSGK